MNKYERKIRELLEGTDVVINGTNPWDPQVKDDRFYQRVIAEGSKGLGESYMEGWWECEQLDVLFDKLLSAKLDEKVVTPKMVLEVLYAKIFNRQTRTGSMKVAKEHYDKDPKLYESFLDPYNQYTCGYFYGTDDLNEAQELKLHMLARKLNIKSGDTVLDIGCGWGGLAKFFALHYDCTVTGVTISPEQAAYARAYVKGLDVKIIETDYRDLPDLNRKWDKVVSVGMVEHVGHKNYVSLMEVARMCIKEDGLFLLHFISGNTSVYRTDPWIDKYIFPNSMLPSSAQISKAAEGLFVEEDMENFGVYYDKTLLAWNENFQRNWNELQKTAPSIYTEVFKRMWEYYLLTCAGSFRSRSNNLRQFVFSPNGVRTGYVRPKVLNLQKIS